MKMISLFNNKQQGFMGMFRKKQRNRSVMWASLFSVALSAIAVFMGRGQKKISTPPLKNFMNNLNENRNIPGMSDAALAEFSEEIISKAVQNNK